MEKEAIKEAVKEALNEKLGEFYVDRETHYKHHEFIDGLLKWTNSAKSEICKTLARGVVIVIFFLLVLGFALWGSHNFKY